MFENKMLYEIYYDKKENDSRDSFMLFVVVLGSLYGILFRYGGDVGEK